MHPSRVDIKPKTQIFDEMSTTPPTPDLGIPEENEKRRDPTKDFDLVERLGEG